MDVYRTSDQFSAELEVLANDSLLKVLRLLQAELGDGRGGMEHAVIDIYAANLGFIRTYLRLLNEHTVTLLTGGKK